MARLAGLGLVRLEGLDTPKLHGFCAEDETRAST
jgi:hypothetical protein